MGLGKTRFVLPLRIESSVCLKKIKKREKFVVRRLVFVSGRQQGDGGGVDTGLTVCVMCSDTQMAADTTQTDAERHSVLSRPLSLLLLLLISKIDVFPPVRLFALDRHANWCKKKKSYHHTRPVLLFLFFTPCLPLPSLPLVFLSSSSTQPLYPGVRGAFCFLAKVQKSQGATAEWFQIKLRSH